ncbi:MAG: ubiquinol-cytochrome c reductase iron-sulfur subunit [Chloroflexota bacterium]
MKIMKKLSRKEFLGVISVAIGGFISAAIGIPAVAYVLGPALKKVEAKNWIALGAAAKVEIGIPTLFKAKVTEKAGWIVNERELSFYILTDDGREFTAMSNICTHLGCRVRWVAGETQFFCPCHNAAFDKNGEVVSGPPPRPLNRYDVKEEDGQLFVLGG